MSLFIFLLLCCPLQEKSDEFNQQVSGFRNKSRFSVEYDKFQDVTRVTVGSFGITAKSAPNRIGTVLDVAARFIHKGRRLGEHAEYFYIYF